LYWHTWGRTVVRMHIRKKWTSAERKDPTFLYLAKIRGSMLKMWRPRVYMNWYYMPIYIRPRDLNIYA
jgi:hypothetical protein